MPLTGLKVLELANILAGPLVGQFCAELGADVIKVERPGAGDPTRGWLLADESVSDGVSAYFSCANRGKRSIALDASRPEASAVISRLAGEADVLIMGYKPGDETRFGLDARTLRAANPGLIYLQLSAYGAADPRPGFDAIIQAESGFTHLNGERDGAGVKMPVALVDLLAAHQLKEGLLLALLRRAQSGEGCYLETSLLGSAVASLANQATNFLVAGAVPERMGSEHPNIVPYGSSFACADGIELVLAVGTQSQFSGLCEALGRPDLPDDPRYRDNAVRVSNRETLNALLEQLFAAHPSDEMASALQARRVPFGRLNDMRQVFAQPAAQAQTFADGLGLRSIALTSDLIPRRDMPVPPRLNAHGTEILAELGLDAAARATLEQTGGWPGEPGPETGEPVPETGEPGPETGKP